MSLETVAIALQDSRIAAFVDGSRYILMVVQAFHLLGLTFLLAVALAFNLRVLRVSLRGLPVPDLARALHWPFVATFAISVMAGVLLFLPRATTYARNDPFVWKLALLGGAAVAQFLLLRKAFVFARQQEASTSLRTLSALALLLWLATGVAGRAIGFV
ncbi:MAG TPA: hypothetical protein VGE69_15445 [Pseudomonadales bacterium]